jgi:predicted nuclease of predicted toxin-antitoxin system
LKFLVDAQLPPALARWISRNHHDATHVFDVGLRSAGDPVVWEYARQQKAILIRKDEDFVGRWLLSDNPHPVDLGSER